MIAIGVSIAAVAAAVVVLVLTILQIRSSKALDTELISAVNRSSAAYQALNKAFSSLTDPPKSTTRDRIEKQLSGWTADTLGPGPASAAQQSETAAGALLKIADADPVLTRRRMESDAATASQDTKSRRKGARTVRSKRDVLADDYVVAGEKRCLLA